MLIHTSNNKISKDTLFKREQWPAFKPKGLWYAPNKEWLNYAEKWIDEIYKYIYLVKVDYTTINKPDRNKVLKITNKDEVIQFTLKYGIIQKSIRSTSGMEYLYIDWRLVERDYGGLDVTELFLKEACVNSYDRYSYILELEKYDIRWLDTWDIPSGCAWNPKAIKQLKLI